VDTWIPKESYGCRDTAGLPEDLIEMEELEDIAALQVR